MLLIFGGLNMNLRSLTRYQALYPPLRAHFIPLDYRHLWFSPNFKTIYKKALVHDRIHVHCLSGGALQYTRFLRKYGEFGSKVVTEVYDNPSHAEAVVNFLNESTNFSPKICRKMLNWLTPEPVAQSTYFLQQPLTNARRLVIQSTNDRICPSEYVDDMIDRWSIDNVWTNDCFHLQSLRTYPTTYKKRVNEL